MSHVEIRNLKGGVLEKFTSDADPLDEPSCIELLRRRARVLKQRPETVQLHIHEGRNKRTYRC